MPSVTALRDRVRGWLRREPKVATPSTVLIVDSTARSRESTARLIAELGYEPLEMSSIGEAVKRLEEEDDPHFVFLAFDLSDADGLQGLTQLHELAPDVPIVMLAANVWDPRMAEALRRGAVAYLAPPFGLDELREILGRR